ncbi:MAG: aminopeptidase [Candidatus Aminicenantes bacterium]|uniref:Leucyl aminopeptidase n=1 Tax=Candidatus Saccharicenans subterraneus TaxID=2508984 RepID=A0A3E2BK55_9BACT|nr:aminopeptidase [Candidatus Aminicenantes bacterium]RFT15130.1 MAG: Leucyl aminopeptidase [Candidatus Saccharicenans subterraneum]
MKATKLYQAAEKAIFQSLKLKPGENFLLVTDKQKMEIAEALAFYAKKAGAETTTYLMTETLRPITEPTKLFKLLTEKADVITYLLDARIQEKPFRGFMVSQGMKLSRICMMPGITVDMMERLVNIDFTRMNEFTKKVIRAMKDADRVIIENEAGTNISFSVKGREWHNDNGDIGKKGKHGNLPAGECYTCPVEETFTGKLVISLIDDKLGHGEMEFKEGRLLRWKGKGIEAIVKNIGSDQTGFIIGEFGIGTNPGARICPNMLEAEKAFGTVHFAIGDSYGIGKNKSKHHYDALVDKVTIIAKGKYIAKNGKFLI